MRVFLSAFLATVWTVQAAAEPLERNEVPPPLAPWVDWALRGAEDSVCPFVHENTERRQCVWPSRLELTLTDSRGRFRRG